MSNDLSIEWENGKFQQCNVIQSKIDEIYIENGKMDFQLDGSDLTFMEEITDYLNEKAHTNSLVKSMISNRAGTMTISSTKNHDSKRKVSDVKPVVIFVSHSDKDNVMATKIGTLINDSYIEFFLAHRDISGGKLWRDVIHEKIKNCDVLVALVTENFHEANYTEQEIGAAWILEKPILVIRVGGIEPRGFVAETQWIKYDDQHSRNTAGEIVKFALTETSNSGKMVDTVVKMLIDAYSYDVSNYLSDILLSQASLTPEHITGIRYALETNSQVSGATLTRRNLNAILEKY